MKRLTNSEMKDWRRCKRRWWLGYYRHLARADVEFNRPLSIGTRVHECLAAYYDPERRIDPLKRLEETLREDLSLHAAFEKDILKEGDLCRAMLEGYVEWLQETGADQGLRLIATEGKREVVLAKGVTLLSKLDARVLRESDGARLALEHKTVGDLSTPLPLLQIDTQLLTEHLVEYLALKREGRESEAAQGVLYNMLRKVKRTVRAKPPFYGRETVMHNQTELRNHWKHVYATAVEITTAEARLASGEDHHLVVPPNPTRDCKWDCPFFAICPLINEDRAEGAIEDLYVTVNPLERYAGLEESNPEPGLGA